MASVLVQQANGLWAKVATSENEGTHTLLVTTAPSTSSLLFMQPNGTFIRVATVLLGDEHTIAVSAS